VAVTVARWIAPNLFGHRLPHVRAFIEHLPKQTQKRGIAGCDAAPHHFLGLIEQQAPLQLGGVDLRHVLPCVRVQLLGG
jgi:hypothetical protein